MMNKALVVALALLGIGHTYAEEDVIVKAAAVDEAGGAKGKDVDEAGGAKGKEVDDAGSAKGKDVAGAGGAKGSAGGEAEDETGSDAEDRARGEAGTNQVEKTGAASFGLRPVDCTDRLEHHLKRCSGLFSPYKVCVWNKCHCSAADPRCQLICSSDRRKMCNGLQENDMCNTDQKAPATCQKSTMTCVDE